MPRMSTLAPAAAACTLVATATGALRAFAVWAPSGRSGASATAGHLRGVQGPGARAQEAAAGASRIPAALGAAACAAASAAGRRRWQRRASTTALKAFTVGAEVAWNGKPGKVRFVGPTQFASGEWVGVELSTPEGMHDGTVMGVEYFECPPKHGVFALPSMLGGGEPAPAAPAAAAPAAASSAAGALLTLGAKVSWNGKEGVVRYLGETKFAGGDWIGVELDTPSGMHNGTVMGVSYFECAPNHGVFAIPAALDVPAGSASASSPPAAAEQEVTVGAAVLWKGTEGVVRYVGTTQFAAGEWVGVELNTGGVHDGTVMGVEYFSCAPGKGIFCQPSDVIVHGEAAAHVGEPSAQNQYGFREGPERLAEPKSFLDGIDIFIFDCDGVIWRGDSLIDGIPSVLDKLRAAGKRCFFVTNNSTKSRKGYKAKFDSLGLDIPPEEIFSSSFAAAAYLEQTKFKESGKKVYIIGEKGIGEELDLIGVPWFGAEADKGKEPFMGSGGKVDQDPDVGAVVVGFDRNVNYYKLQYAQLCINQNPGCKFIATNTDRVTHLTDAQEWAGNGSMVGAIKGCTGQEPTVVGKPSPLMIDYLEEKYKIPNRKRICMVGDRLDTDILFGRNNGLQTCLTLSGVTSEELLLSPDNAITPDVYVSTINDFFS